MSTVNKQAHAFHSPRKHWLARHSLGRVLILTSGLFLEFRAAVSTCRKPRAQTRSQLLENEYRIYHHLRIHLRLVAWPAGQSLFLSRETGAKQMLTWPSRAYCCTLSLLHFRWYVILLLLPDRRRCPTTHDTTRHATYPGCLCAALYKSGGEDWRLV